MIQSRWMEEARRGETLREYPRPQLKRADWLCLNGTYEYAITGDTMQQPQRFDGTILLPFAPECALSGVNRPLQPQERLWYRRKFSLPEHYAGKRILLHFGAVDWQCIVYVNGQAVGEHSGGYLPFSFDITDALRAQGSCSCADCTGMGIQELLVRVYDPTDTAGQQRGKQVRDPKGIWYTATSGIWQTVWLEPVEPCHIKALRMTPHLEAESLQLQLKQSEYKYTKATARVMDGETQLACVSFDKEADIPLPGSKLRSPETPFLYTLHIELTKAGEICDKVESYFGMRSFSIGNDSKGLPRILLNGKPYFQRGLLDQGYWPESGLTPPSDEAMVYDIQTMKDLGFNMLRKHIKVEPLRWYYHCDRLGMLVWQDMPSGGAYIGNLMAGVLSNMGVPIRDSHYSWFKRADKNDRAEFRRELFEMLEILHNCTSICCWVPFNEGWGQFDARAIARAVKESDPSRLVDHASGWYDQMGPDFKSVHKYIVPVRMPKTNGRPFALTEYGGYSLLRKGHAWDEKKAFGYRMFESKEILGEHYRSLHEKQIIPLIEKGLCATIYTQLSDVENEVNGIVSYDRAELKMDAELLRDVNRKLDY